MPKAYVLHSGGIDSTTCLYLAAKQFGDHNVMGVSVNYGQRHCIEIERSKDLCFRLGYKHQVVDMPEPPKSLLTDKDSKIPEVSYDDLPEGISPTYVPFRNGQLLSRVAGIASADEEAQAIYFGAHAEDAANWAYPDCTPEFIGAMANAIYIGTYFKIRLMAPLMSLVKHEIITLGESLGVPWDATWSCYVGGTKQCGKCSTCLSRREGFTDAGIKDPTEYLAL